MNKVVYVKFDLGTYYSRDLFINKIYEYDTKYSTNGHYLIVEINKFVEKIYFITLEEWRELRINKILE